MKQTKGSRAWVSDEERTDQRWPGDIMDDRMDVQTTFDHDFQNLKGSPQVSLSSDGHW